jgi:sugar phosphate isomerase/epimerase/8-oxo-dGTP pyrophosphatase MutT (NUDIX family)
MNLSTTIRILKDKTLENLEKELEVLSKSKFNNINFGFTEIQNLLDEDIDLSLIANKCKELNLISNTGHAPIHWPFFFNNYYNRPDKDILEKRIFKSIQLAKLFDIKWLVIHVGTYLDTNGKYDIEKSIEYNIEYLDKFVKEAYKNGIKVAIENGTQMEEDTTPYVEELIRLVDYFNSKYGKEVLGICFDFGHANVGNLDIYKEIKSIGNRLKATHIHDNYGADDHNFPYTGTVNWNQAMKALKEINYKGELNLEVRYNPKLEEFCNKDTITVDLINTTYSLLERLKNLMEDPDQTSINVICPKENNTNYTKRKGAYVIIKKDKDKIAIANEGNKYFFIGGGIEAEETEKEALKREVLEETGYTLKNIEYFDTVKSYEYNENHGYLEIIATIYTAEFDEKVSEKIEKNEIIICNPKEYEDKLYHEYQRYVLKKYINKH